MKVNRVTDLVLTLNFRDAQTLLEALDSVDVEKTFPYKRTNDGHKYKQKQIKELADDIRAAL